MAARRDIAVQFLEGLFATLRRGGMLQSRRSVKGGFIFARQPGEVTVLEVVELLEGEVGAGAAARGPVWTEATRPSEASWRARRSPTSPSASPRPAARMYYIWKARGALEAR